MVLICSRNQVPIEYAGTEEPPNQGQASGMMKRQTLNVNFVGAWRK